MTTQIVGLPPAIAANGTSFSCSPASLTCSTIGGNVVLNLANANDTATVLVTANTLASQANTLGLQLTFQNIPAGITFGVPQLPTNSIFPAANGGVCTPPDTSTPAQVTLNCGVPGTTNIASASGPVFTFTITQTGAAPSGALTVAPFPTSEYVYKSLSGDGESLNPTNQIAFQRVTGFSITLQAGSGTGSAYNLVPLALEGSGIANVQQLVTAICGSATNCARQVLIWNASTQTFVAWVPGQPSPPSLTTGQAVFVALLNNAPATFGETGTQPATGVVRFTLKAGTATTCAYNALTVPFDAGVPTNSEALAQALSNRNNAQYVRQMLLWHETSQTFEVFQPGTGSTPRTLTQGQAFFACLGPNVKASWP